MARPAVSYRALALGADARAVGVIAGVYALLPLFAAVPLGRRTDHGRCAPLLPAGVALIALGCALSGAARSLPAMAAWSGVMGLGHLAFVIGAQSIVARQSAPAERDRDFGHFTMGAALGQLIGPVAAGLLVSEHDGALARTSATALFAAAAVAACSVVSLHRVEHRPAAPGAPGRAAAEAPVEGGAARVPVARILRTRGVGSGILISLAVLSATDVLTAYLPVVGEQRAISPTVIGVLLGLRAAATVACRLVLAPMVALLGRPGLLIGSCLGAGLLCASVALPLPVWALGVVLAALGFCLGVGQPLSMSTVVRAAPGGARSTALALRLTGNRLGQVAAPAGAGALAGVAGTAAPFVLLGGVLLVSSAVAARLPGEARRGPGGEGARAATDEGRPAEASPRARRRRTMG
ncbi:MFS transporter [Streptomyces sp. LX-29]|nr:MFS transporter [Streptomyces sp. LX-29]